MAGREMEALAMRQHEASMAKRRREIREAMYEQLRQRAMEEAKRKGTWDKPGVQVYSPATPLPGGGEIVTDPRMHMQVQDAMRQIRETRPAVPPQGGGQQFAQPQAPPLDGMMDAQRFEFGKDFIPEWLGDEMRFEYPG